MARLQRVKAPDFVDKLASESSSLGGRGERRVGGQGASILSTPQEEAGGCSLYELEVVAVQKGRRATHGATTSIYLGSRFCMDYVTLGVALTLQEF